MKTKTDTCHGSTRSSGYKKLFRIKSKMKKRLQIKNHANKRSLKVINCSDSRLVKKEITLAKYDLKNSFGSWIKLDSNIKSDSGTLL